MRGGGSHLKEHKHPPHQEEDFNSEEEEAAARVDRGEDSGAEMGAGFFSSILLLAVIAFCVQ